MFTSFPFSFSETHIGSLMRQWHRCCGSLFEHRPGGRVSRGIMQMTTKRWPRLTLQPEWSATMHTPNPNERTGNGDASRSSQGRAEQLQETAKQTARDQAMAGAERSKEAASKTARQSAEALDKAASSFRDQGQTSMAHTTSSIAKNLSSLANRLEGRSADELVQDVVQLARRSPNTFLLGGLAAGLVLSRFFKASPKSSRAESSSTQEPDPRTH